MKTRNLSICFVILFLLLAGIVSAKEYKVVVPQMPEPVIAPYKNLINLFPTVSTDTFPIEIVPFARGFYLISEKQADILLPLLEIPDVSKHAALKFDYSTVNIIDIVFVLCSNKSKNVDVAELKKGNPKKFKIETDMAHTDYFSFACTGSTNAEASLKKVDAGTIDGYIFGQPTTNLILKKIPMKNIKRQYYDTFHMKFLIQKGTKGGELDKKLTVLIEKLKANGKYQEVLKFDAYNDWQP